MVHNRIDMSAIANGTWKVQQQGYSRDQIQNLCKNKLIVFIGDSVTRGIYKDFVKLIRGGGLLSDRDLKKKGEREFETDRLVEGGTLDGLFNGKNYIEVREYRSRSICIRFYFVTRCYYDYMETILQDFMEQPVPDVVFVSSCCWDVTRWSDEVKSGGNALVKYKANLETLFTRFSEVLQDYCLVIWGCCMPMGEQVRGGFLDPGMQWQQETLRLDILEANYFASIIAESHNYDVIDFHWFFRSFQHSRKGDGIHWNASAHRNMTYIIINHITEAWGIKIKPSEMYAVKIVSEADQYISKPNWLNVNGTRADSVPGSYSASRPLMDNGYHRGNSSYKMVNRRRDLRQDPYARPEQRYSSYERNMMSDKTSYDQEQGRYRHNNISSERMREMTMFDRWFSNGTHQQYNSPSTSYHDLSETNRMSNFQISQPLLCQPHPHAHHQPQRTQQSFFQQQQQQFDTNNQQRYPTYNRGQQQQLDRSSWQGQLF